VNYTCEGSGKWQTLDGINISVAPTTLYAQMARTDLGPKWYFHLREMIGQVWGVDAPYSWHLERVLQRYGAESFAGNPEFCLQFTEAYICEIQAVEDRLLEQTGASLSFHV
jgi:hypothetical protein